MVGSQRRIGGSNRSCAGQFLRSRLVYIRGAGQWGGGLGCEAAQRTGARKQLAQTDVCRPVVREPGLEGCHRKKKSLRPSKRQEVVTHLVRVNDLLIQRACRAVGLNRAT